MRFLSSPCKPSHYLNTRVAFVTSSRRSMGHSEIPSPAQSRNSGSFLGRLSSLASSLIAPAPKPATRCVSALSTGAGAMDAPSKRSEVITVGGGCFWCVEACLSRVHGVHSAISGYAGGHVHSPSYEQVCAGVTGHTEVVRASFDPREVSARELLLMFFAVHDPTTKDRQGHDVGTQYRSAVYCHSPRQLQIAREVIAQVEREKWYGSRPVVTEVKMVSADDVNYDDDPVVDNEAPPPSAAAPGRLALPFYPAEAYHQDYFAANPSQGYCRAVVSPKVAKFRSQFAAKLRN